MMAKIVTTKCFCDHCKGGVGESVEMKFKLAGREIALHFCADCSRNLLWTQVSGAGNQKVAEFVGYYENRGLDGKQPPIAAR